VSDPIHSPSFHVPNQSMLDSLSVPLDHSLSLRILTCPGVPPLAIDGSCVSLVRLPSFSVLNLICHSAVCECPLLSRFFHNPTCPPLCAPQCVSAPCLLISFHILTCPSPCSTGRQYLPLVRLLRYLDLSFTLRSTVCECPLLAGFLPYLDMTFNLRWTGCEFPLLARLFHIFTLRSIGCECPPLESFHILTRPSLHAR
jgi:hypothetical protein